MSRASGQSWATVGFSVKSGWAAVVLLSGGPVSPRVVESSRIDLSDPSVPDGRQPYHAGFGTARVGGLERARLLRSVRQFGRRSVAGLIERYRSEGHRLSGAGIVVGSLVDPGSIANDHIRIHALEGQLFRGIVTDALTASALRCSMWRERDLHAEAARLLRRSGQDLRGVVTAMGRAVDGSWRAEQKAATVAAWIVLTTEVRAAKTSR